ncbi:MAG: methyltransferase domain-containing protein [Ardenticatenaceae bacterium]|nr:methyltransferase domain-containing protein [Ardenticatenaceae bacterium]
MSLKHFWQKLLRFGFRLLYNELAWTYDVVSWLVSLGEWREWQQAALPFVAGRDVLEIGHGPGHMLLALQNARFQAVGLDLSPFMGRRAQRRTQRTVPLVRGKVQDLPFGTAVFDTVLATFPTEYIIDPAALTAVARVLRPDGRLVVVPEGRLRGRGLLQRLIEWLFAVTGQRYTAGEVDDEQETAIWQQYLPRFQDAGFTVQFVRVERPRSRVTVLLARQASDG